ncbi:MAG TPA: hypothetical protein VMJ11_07805, partial [Paraburkholderia sp.]|uniref:hypothetical protein n=1 Tax=Paraburkholderia sp. TaxID=1926495 RepID=UPI002BCD5FB6
MTWKYSWEVTQAGFFLILHKINYRSFCCSGNMRMSCFSKIQMSCFAADAMLGVSGLIAGARHARSRTGDTEHARTR